MYANVFQLAGLPSGETLLVHGGSSGIGTMAIQLGKAFGATGRLHRGIAGEAGPLPRARRRRRHQLPGRGLRRGRCSTPPAGAGADVILDIMGASYLDRNLAALATGGRLVIIGRQGGSRAEIDLGVLQGKRASVHATTLRARPSEGEGRGRGGRARPRLAAHRRREGRRRHRQGAADVAGGAGAPGRWRPASTSARSCSAKLTPRRLAAQREADRLGE